MIVSPNNEYQGELKPLNYPSKMPKIGKGPILTFKLTKIRTKPRLMNWIHIIPAIRSLRLLVSFLGFRNYEVSSKKRVMSSSTIPIIKGIHNKIQKMKESR